jgi:hypothetical protein
MFRFGPFRIRFIRHGLMLYTVKNWKVGRSS